MKRIVILGTGGNCIDILETIIAINQASDSPLYECVAFLDDDQSLWGKNLHGVAIRGPLEKASEFDDSLFVNGIGSPSNFWRKKEIIARAGIPSGRFVSLIHPTASVSPSAKLGHGVVILQNVTVASNVTVGDQVIILPNSVVSHDDLIGDYTCITGGVCISGGVTVGQSCYLGSNSSIIGNITIGDGSLIGMGSVVLEDVPANTVMVGNPAKAVRKVKESK